MKLNYNHITPVGLSEEPYEIFPKLVIDDKVQVEDALRSLGLDVSLGLPLKGGVVSLVYEGNTDNTPVIIKYTKDHSDADPTNYYMPSETHFIDLLHYLKDQVRVPAVYFSDARNPLTVMEDLRTDDYTLISLQLLNGILPLSSAKDIGSDIAVIQKSLSEHMPFYSALSGPQLYYSRGQELRQIYPSHPEYYRENFERFINENQQLSAVDTHPKNSFTDSSGNVAWIDFGCSAWCDRDFALPNFLAHIAVYSIAGYVDTEEATLFIRDSIDSYSASMPIDEQVFSKYFAGEILHRWAGKWIEGIDSTEKKINILKFGTAIYDEKKFSIDSLLNHLETIKNTKCL
jgi:hypothetical protein